MYNQQSRDALSLRTVVVGGLLLTACNARPDEQTGSDLTRQTRGDDAVRPQTCKCPGNGQSNSYYTSNRAPLLRSPLVKLPLGSVQPRGWLKHQLELMVEGMTGRLPELSPYLKDDNGWFGSDKEGWEEQPYWFRGFHDLAVLTGDTRCIEIARRWIEAVLNSQDADGYFGARHHKGVAGKNGQVICDLWPHMVMLDAVIQHAEHTGDARVVPFLQRFFAFCRDLPDARFIPPIQPGYGDWKPTIQHARAGDMLPHIYWLYNRTGEAWLLDVARRFSGRITPPASEWLDHHVVNFTQRFQYPGACYALSGDRRHLELTEYWYAQHLGTWGQQPRGIFGADENLRPGKVDPRQGFETCGMTEFAKSFYLLGRITGDPVYADRTEDIMLNHFPAAQTPDLKALHYLTAANLPQLDRNDHDFCNKGWMLPYSPHTYRCCQHNVAMGWPWYVQNLWQATGDNGLAMWMYGASAVTAKVGTDGGEVRIDAATDFPFRTQVILTLHCTRSVRFPLYLRVPRWCDGFAATVNGKPLGGPAQSATWLKAERTWRDGDTVELDMPVKLALTVWPRTGSVTVDRGPLSYSVRIAEDWRRAGGSDAWPAWEVFPKSAWNYGLAVDRDNPDAGLEVSEKPVSPTQPWTLDAAPVEIKAKARRIPGWRIEGNTVQPLRQGPIRSNQTEETITLIPLGCARLRMSCLPLIGDGPDATEWPPPPKRAMDVTASHCGSNDTTDAIVDGVIAKDSNDQSIPRFTWWDHKGTDEWVEGAFDKPRQVSTFEVYWFDDTGTGQCRVPANWRILYRDGGTWKPVRAAGTPGVEKDKFNRVTFEPVTTDALRLEVKLQPDFSGGILEARVP